MDDPQMFAQALFLACFWVYLQRRRSLLAITTAALLFVLKVSIKQNLMTFR